MFQSFLLDLIGVSHFPGGFLLRVCSNHFDTSRSSRLVAETLAIVGKIDWFAGESLWHMYNLLLGWFLFFRRKNKVPGDSGDSHRGLMLG